jgi:hypothetical protein
MDKKFLIKILIVAVAVVVVYYIISPYHSCKRDMHKAMGGDKKDYGLVVLECSRSKNW